MITQDTTRTMLQRQSSQSLNLGLALRYPFQAQNWFARLLPLALVQLLPVIGQLILLGYGIQVVHVIYTEQSDLPNVQWLRAFGDGLRVAVAAFIFTIPIFLTVLLLLIGGSSGENSLSMPLLLILSLVVAPFDSRLQKTGNRMLRLIGKLLALLPLLAIIVTIIGGVSSFISARNHPVPVAAPQIGLPMIMGGSLLVFIIFTATLVGAVRLGITNTGLFDAPGTAKLLLQHGRATAWLVLKLLLLLVITVLTSAAGLVVFIVPGLVILVACSAAAWHLLTQFGMSIGLINVNEMHK